MSRRLLLPLLISMFACLGAECSGSSSSGSSSSSGVSGVTFAGQEVRGHIERPVPEPSAALVFGLGLIVAGVATRRNKR